MTGSPGVAAGPSSGFSIVVAMDKNRGIGKDGGLPWPKLKGDMKFFRELTTCPDRAAVEKRWGLKAEDSAAVHTWDEVSAMLKFAHPLPVAEVQNVVVMGRKTWESLPAEYKPLPSRVNYALTRKGITGGDELDDINIGPLDMVEFTSDAFPDHQIFIIGGGQVYLSVLTAHLCKYLYITEIDSEFPCDTFFPETLDFKPVLSSPWIEEGGVRYRFRRYDRVS